MQYGYFNYYGRVAEGWWDRREFVRHWWRLKAADRRWTPPPFRVLYRALVSDQFAHVTRQQPTLFHVEALPGRPRPDGDGMRSMATPLMEEPVAAAVALADPRRRDGTVGLGLLTCANDEESLERLLGKVYEVAWQHGGGPLIGPVGLSPYLGCGVLESHFHQTPPLHTPYNPPYLPEVLAATMTPIQTTRLYTLPVQPPPTRPDTVQLTPLDPARLAGDLRPLLAALLSEGGDFPAPDADEAAFLLAWWGAWPLVGWLAEAQGTPVGFLLAQSDLADPVRWAKGGRSWWRRPWLAWRVHRAARAGRVLAGGVLPAWRNQGIGGQLWRALLDHATRAGWQTITAGPLDEASAAAGFLSAQGATPQQRYVLYTADG